MLCDTVISRGKYVLIALGTAFSGITAVLLEHRIVFKRMHAAVRTAASRDAAGGAEKLRRGVLQLRLYRIPIRLDLKAAIICAEIGEPQ